LICFFLQLNNINSLELLIFFLHKINYSKFGLLIISGVYYMKNKLFIFIVFLLSVSGIFGVELKLVNILDQFDDLRGFNVYSARNFTLIPAETLPK
jgi:hypothetical protein